MKHIFHYLNDTTKKHFVYIAECFTYGIYPSAWMGDSNLPKSDSILIPDLDIVKEENIFSFDTEQEAMEKVAFEYGMQSEKIRAVLEQARKLLAMESNSLIARVNLINKIDKLLEK